MYMYTFIGCHLCEHHIHSYFVHVMQDFIFISVFGELGVIFLLSKFYFGALDIFLFICHSVSFFCVIMLLGYYLYIFFYKNFHVRALLYHLYHFSRILIRLDAPFINIFICDIIYGIDTFLVIKFRIVCDLIAWFTINI